MNAHEIKMLQTLRSKKDAERNALKEEVASKQKQLATLHAELKDLDKRIGEAKDIEPTVSEHAMLRFLERRKEINLQELAIEIMPEAVREQVRTIGSGKIEREGFSLIVKQNQVVTIET